jgi:hypothetical protein
VEKENETRSSGSHGHRKCIYGEDKGVKSGMLFDSDRKREDATVIVEGEEKDEDVLRLGPGERIDSIIMTPEIEKIVVSKGTDSSNSLPLIATMLSLVNTVLLLILVLRGGLQ